MTFGKEMKTEVFSYIDHEKKVDRLIKTQFSHAFMSNAKWRKFFTLLDRPELNITQAVWKLVGKDTEIRGWFTKKDELQEDRIDDHGAGPSFYKEIEWVEIVAVGIPLGCEGIPAKYWTQDIAGARSLLMESGMWEIEETERGIRIYGFKK